MDSIKIEQLVKDRDFDLRLELLAGEGGLDRRVVSSRIQKPRLALSGFTEHIHKDRLQVFGNTEISYLATLRHDEALKRVRDLSRLPIACLVVTKNLPVEDWVKREATDARVPLLRSSHLSSAFIDNIARFLQEALTASTSVHGVLIDVIGVGMLILGKSGIGKSELALDLVTRGHRLVADDIVDLKRRQGGSVYGSGSEIIKHHMEIRGIGIINIKDLFGVSAVRERKKVEMVVELVEWDDKVEYDRLGVEEQKYTILDIEVPLLVIPVRPGRNLTTIVEVAARNHLLKLQGHHSAKEFQEKLSREIAQAPSAQPGRQRRGGHRRGAAHAGAAPRSRRPDRRHHADERSRAARRHHREVRRTRPRRQAQPDPAELRLPQRDSRGERSGVRRSLPAESVLRGGPEAAPGERPEG